LERAAKCGGHTKSSQCRDFEANTAAVDDDEEKVEEAKPPPPEAPGSRGAA
jgi:hypothetical protein